MANRTRNAVGMAAATLIMATGSAAAAQDRVTVSVRLYNYTAATTSELTFVQEQAARVFQAAGVDIRWQHDGTAPVSLVILPRDMTEKKAAEEGIPNAVLGRAAAATGRAYAFYDRVVTIAMRRRVNARELLATIVAHELGHVLLGESSHSREGIMRADLEPTRTAGKGFTNAQAAAIRARLNATLSAAR